MKKTVNNVLRFALGTYLVGGLTLAASAQNQTPQKGEMRLKVTERNGGDLREIERTYRTDGMTDEKRDAIVNKLIDSLRATRKGKDSQISVTIEDDRGSTNTRLRNRSRSDSRDISSVFSAPQPPYPPAAPTGPDEFDMHMDINTDMVMGLDTMSPAKRRELRLKMDSLRVSLRQLQRELAPMARQLERDIKPMAERLQRDLGRAGERLQRDLAPMQERLQRNLAPMVDRMNRMKFDYNLDNRPFDAWANGDTQSATIRGLDAYPSNPDRNMLNVRFNTRTKGDVLIVVTNPKGKEVAKRELNEFTGDFVGQVDLGRKAEGVYFVTVTQNEDGAVRRVVLKKGEATK